MCVCVEEERKIQSTELDKIIRFSDGIYDMTLRRGHKSHTEYRLVNSTAMMTQCILFPFFWLINVQF